MPRMLSGKRQGERRQRRSLGDFFEDLLIGTSLELGSHTFTADEIVGFAQNYDPQPFHLDATEAAKSQLGRLSASAGIRWRYG
jgi:acyl dehydratase